MVPNSLWLLIIHFDNKNAQANKNTKIEYLKKFCCQVKLSMTSNTRYPKMKSSILGEQM